ncbi:MAG TPA: dienelactone hydrolase family protein [Chloroflexota bacterium]|nr:dienelactone hydrolase family protein [Chloroflexota bacterium]
MCFDDDSYPPIPLSSGSAVHGEDQTIRAADGNLIAAYLAEPSGPAQGQVVVLPDVRGLHNFYKGLALRFADTGKRALVIDYFGRTAENNDRTEPFDYMTHVQQMTPETFGADLDAAVSEIRKGVGQDLPTFTVGFCMGGSLSFWAGTRGYDLAGVIGFYANLTRHFGAVTPALDWARQIECPVLGLFGGADQSIPVETVETFERELNEGGIENELVIYPGAPHSFFDRKAEEFSSASEDAWRRVQGFIAGHETVHV